MTAPIPQAYGGIHNVEEDEIVQGCVKWMLAKPDLMALLSHFPGLYPYTPYLFQHVLPVRMESKSANALVVRYMGGWSGPNAGNTLEFPRVGLEFYCDPIRDENKNVIEEAETIRRLVYIYKQFDKIMHRPKPLPGSPTKVEWWGTVRTIECTRLGEFSYDPVPDGSGLMLGTVQYGVQVG